MEKVRLRRAQEGGTRDILARCNGARGMAWKKTRVYATLADDFPYSFVSFYADVAQLGVNPFK